MSKAFTKEDADVPEAPRRRLGVPVPAGAPNYVTAAGAETLRGELAALQAGPRDESGDDRVRELTDHLASAVIVEPAPGPAKAGFGTAVTLEGASGERVAYRLVGAIEAAPKAGAISWHSPIARALEDAAVGDAVVLPRGEYTVVAIEPA